MSNDTYDYDYFYDNKNRRKIKSEVERLISNYERDCAEEKELYENIGAIVSLITKFKLVSNIFELEKILYITIRARQFGIDELVYREEIQELDDIAEYADEINWSTVKYRYSDITKSLEYISLAIKYSEEILAESSNMKQIISVEDFKNDMRSKLERLMRVDIDFTEEKEELYCISVEEQNKYIKLMLKKIEDIDAELVKDIQKVIGG